MASDVWVGVVRLGRAGRRLGLPWVGLPWVGLPWVGLPWVGLVGAGRDDTDLDQVGGGHGEGG